MTDPNAHVPPRTFSIQTPPPISLTPPTRQRNTGQILEYYELQGQLDQGLRHRDTKPESTKSDATSFENGEDEHFDWEREDGINDEQFDEEDDFDGDNIEEDHDQVCGCLPSWLQRIFGTLVILLTLAAPAAIYFAIRDKQDKKKRFIEDAGAFTCE